MATKYILQDKIDSGCWEGDRVGGTQNVSPHLDNKLHWQDLSNVTIWGLWSLWKACNFQGRAWVVNCGQFWSFSALGAVELTTPWQAVVRAFHERLVSSLWRPGWVKKELVLQISGICAMMLLVASYLRDRNKEAGSHHCCISSRCCKPFLSGPSDFQRV